MGKPNRNTVIGRSTKHDGDTVAGWRKWIESELKPPCAECARDPIMRYVLEAFLDLTKRVMQE